MALVIKLALHQSRLYMFDYSGLFLTGTYILQRPVQEFQPSFKAKLLLLPRVDNIICIQKKMSCFND